MDLSANVAELSMTYTVACASAPTTCKHVQKLKFKQRMKSLIVDDGEHFEPENKQFPVPRGKGLGGSSLLNCMLYVRGNKRDYDQWADNGATGWSWRDIYSYFLKAENNTDPEFANNGYHSTGGFLTVSTPPETNALKEAFGAAAQELGYEYRDINGEKQAVWALSCRRMTSLLNMPERLCRMASQWPSDYFLFPKLKEYLSGITFSSDRNVRTDAENKLNGQRPNF
ncbi:Glucose dehydrogenase [FAD, quinone] [Araneus ventricosus]|uniref:Glucose dehydrogenase [FAD, quinone] n=1 Tax=Araneus ventricosus TaxID=182803 RepID=A0A4Y2UWE9_ARAVE|nr:Glucose dehydrogenase [FAD, quinone] [Araneus ventricosus]